MHGQRNIKLSLHKYRATNLESMKIHKRSLPEYKNI